MHNVVGVDDADDLGVGRGQRQPEPQSAGLEAGKVVGPDEFEAIAERTAMLLDRAPQGRIGRVVDQHDAFEIRVIETRYGLERLHQHFRRLAVGRDMDRDFRHGRRGAERR